MRHDDAAIEDLVTHALETSPVVAIPDGFAVRVMQQVPPQRGSRARAVGGGAGVQAPHWGMRLLYASMLLLLAAMVLVAPRTVAGGAVWTTVEWALCIQLMLLALLAGKLRHEVR